jgi:hypothetical protein
MKTEIGQLKLTLPAGFEGRAALIGRLLGEALARQPLRGGQLASIAVGPLEVDARGSDRAIAQSIARAIAQSVDESIEETRPCFHR